MTNARAWYGLCATCLMPWLVGCEKEAVALAESRASLAAVCASSIDALPEGAWLCGSERAVECDAQPGTAAPAEIFVVVEDGCEDRALVADPGPFALGRNEVVISEPFDAIGVGTPSQRELCRSTLNVVDTIPPRLRPWRGELWPPNHSFYTIAAATCAGATDDCDSALSVHFTSATSDEPEDAKGDGSHQPDILFEGPATVSLRAERQGSGNGRVYTLGFRAIDRSGNAAEGTCEVVVPHDRSGRQAVADAPVYRVAAPLP